MEVVEDAIRLRPGAETMANLETNIACLLRVDRGPFFLRATDFQALAPVVAPQRMLLMKRWCYFVSGVNKCLTDGIGGSVIVYFPNRGICFPRICTPMVLRYQERGDSSYELKVTSDVH